MKKVGCLEMKKKVGELKALKAEFDNALVNSNRVQGDFDVVKKYKSEIERLVSFFKELRFLEWKGMDWEKVKEWGLAEFKLQAELAAQEMMNRVTDLDHPQYINFRGSREKNLKKRNLFASEWHKNCPGIPVPEYRRDNFCYPELLQLGKILKDVRGEKVLDAAKYDNSGSFLVDGWEEKGLHDTFSNPNESKIINYILPGESVINISKTALEEALWKDGDVIVRKKTDKHREAIKLLGLNPDKFEVRLPTYEELSRIANTELGKRLNIGARLMWTHIEGYLVSEVGIHQGLISGFKITSANEKISSLGCHNENEGQPFIATRLIVAKME